MEQKNKRLMVFLAGELCDEDAVCRLIGTNSFDFYAADAGYLLAQKFAVTPKEVFGDFDSMPMPKLPDIRVFPTEKDQTDSEIALDLAIENGYREIWMIAPFGGRLDHTYANLCLLEKAIKNGVTLYLYDGRNQTCLLQKGVTEISSGYRYYSFFPWKDKATISLKGFKYPLDRYQLISSSPLAISNESASDNMSIEVHEGTVLYISVQ